jgi:hypothetical protein
MKRALLIALAAALSGCATFDGVALENRLACTVAGDKLFVISQYGPVGISSNIADADRAKVCK